MVDNQSEEITNKLAEALSEEATTVENDLDDFHNWMLKKGKNPARKKSLSTSQASNYHARIDQLYRFVIDRLELDDQRVITQEQAHQLIEWLDHDTITAQIGDSYSEGAKRKFSNTLKKYFQWRNDEGACEEQWEPRISFSDGDHESADKLSFKERWQVRKAALNYGSLPSYYETAPGERDRINGLVAQRLGKPKDEITANDWKRADTSSKVGSLVAVGLETGMIPIEIQEARIEWYDQKRNVFTIPQEYAAKDRPTTDLPLTEETGDILSKWIKERRHYEEYDGTNLLWLNSWQNPYQSKNLCYLVRRLCNEADIDHENRRIVWYSLRHNLGQTIEEEESLSQARDQLRHKHISTTKSIYAESTIESRRQTLKNINQVAQQTAENPNFSPYTDEPKRRSPQYPDESTSKSTNGSTTHIDAVIDDTQSDRSDLAQKILSEEI